METSTYKKLSRAIPGRDDSEGIIINFSKYSFTKNKFNVLNKKLNTQLQEKTKKRKN